MPVADIHRCRQRPSSSCVPSHRRCSLRVTAPAEQEAITVPAIATIEKADPQVPFPFIHKATTTTTTSAVSPMIAIRR